MSTDSRGNDRTHESHSMQVKKALRLPEIDRRAQQESPGAPNFEIVDLRAPSPPATSPPNPLRTRVPQQPPPQRTAPTGSPGRHTTDADDDNQQTAPPQKSTAGHSKATTTGTDAPSDEPLTRQKLGNQSVRFFIGLAISGPIAAWLGTQAGSGAWLISPLIVLGLVGGLLIRGKYFSLDRPSLLQQLLAYAILAGYILLTVKIHDTAAAWVTFVSSCALVTATSLLLWPTLRKTVSLRATLVGITLLPTGIATLLSGLSAASEAGILIAVSASIFGVSLLLAGTAMMQHRTKRFGTAVVLCGVSLLAMGLASIRVGTHYFFTDLGLGWGCIAQGCSWMQMAIGVTLCGVAVLRASTRAFSYGIVALGIGQITYGCAAPFVEPFFREGLSRILLPFAGVPNVIWGIALVAYGMAVLRRNPAWFGLSLLAYGGAYFINGALFFLSGRIDLFSSVFWSFLLCCALVLPGLAILRDKTIPMWLVTGLLGLASLVSALSFLSDGEVAPIGVVYLFLAGALITAGVLGAPGQPAQNFEWEDVEEPSRKIWARLIKQKDRPT